MSNFTDAVLAELGCTYELPDGTRIQGNSISSLSEGLRDKGWKGVSNLNDLEDEVQRLGFKIVNAQTVRFGNKRGRTARVVTL